MGQRTEWVDVTSVTSIRWGRYADADGNEDDGLIIECGDVVVLAGPRESLESMIEDMSDAIKDDRVTVCRHCEDFILISDKDEWVDENGLTSCAPHAEKHEPVA